MTNNRLSIIKERIRDSKSARNITWHTALTRCSIHIWYDESARLNEFIAIRMFKCASPSNRNNFIAATVVLDFVSNRKSHISLSGVVNSAANWISFCWAFFSLLHCIGFVFYFENNFSRHCEYSPCICVWWILLRKHIRIFIGTNNIDFICIGRNMR